jgi:hypothetical protein
LRKGDDPPGEIDCRPDGCGAGTNCRRSRANAPASVARRRAAAGLFIGAPGAFGRAHREALGEQRARETIAPRSLRRGDERLGDEIALRMTAADPDCLEADRRYLLDGAPVVSFRKGEEAVDQPPADIRGDGAIVAASVRDIGVERAAQPFDAFSGTVLIKDVEVPAQRILPTYLGFTKPSVHGAVAQIIQSAIDAGARSTLEIHNLDRHWRNARTHTLHDPVRWKFHAIGNYHLNWVRPPRHSWL